SVIYLSIQYKKIFGKKSNVAKELSKEKLTIIEKKQLKTNFLKTGIPVSFSSLLNKIILSANTILLPQMLMVAGLSREMAMDEFAILFSMTMPLVVLPSCVIMPITTIVMPKISEYCVTDSLDLIKRKSAKMLQIVGMCAIPLFWILLFFANPIFQTIYSSTRGEKYAAILALTTLIEYYQISSASILNGLGHSVRASLSILVEGIIQLVCTITLVPIFKIDGFIIGDILSIVVAATMNVTAVKKHTKIKFKLKNWLLNPLIASVISVLIANLIYISLLNFTIMTFALILSIISFFIIYFIILRLLGNKLIEYIKKTILISEK
ncbi:MAG: polysaccharide biosynthesis C-terminal domain-containing protein, partial [Oscillospiraceae bacterium]